MAGAHSNRRMFLKATGLALAGAIGPRTGQPAGLGEEFVRPGGAVPPGEWWAGGGPREAPSTAVLAGTDEPGERLVLSGTVFAADGTTVVRGVTVYAYQTDVLGLYTPENRQGTPPRLRAWAATDGAGRYEFQTIKPGHYPNRTLPAHIHMTVSSDRLAEWWLPEVRFTGDPFLRPDDERLSAASGRFGNVRPLVSGPGGVLRCTRDLRI